MVLLGARLVELLRHVFRLLLAQLTEMSQEAAILTFLTKCWAAILPQVGAWVLAMALLTAVLALVTGGDILMDFVDVATR